MKSKANKKLKYGTVEVQENPFDPKETKIKITAWFDADMILALRAKAAKEGLKYQTYMNRLLREAVLEKSSLEKRIEALERKFDKPKTNQSASR